MTRPVLLLPLLVGLVVGDAGAQSVPEGSQASDLAPWLRRTPSFRIDPFRHVMIPRWGFAISVGGSAENNALNLEDVGALMLLDDDDKIGYGDAIDVLGLVPRGRGIAASGLAESGAYMGGRLFGGLSIGFSAQGRAYGAFLLDDDAAALLRDGNGARQDFTLGDSRGAALASLDYGLHAVLRLGPVYSLDGPIVVLGAGGRLVRPVFYGRGRSTIANGGTIRVTGDSIVANVAIESHYTNYDDFTVSDALGSRGSGVAADFLVRLEWPTNGFALEAMVANIGKVTVEDLEHRTGAINVSTTILDSVIGILDTFDLTVVGTETLDVTLPRIVRFRASAWANRILQIDLFTTLPAGGDFPTVIAVDIGTTWRFVKALPLRFGLVVGGHQGVGFTGGFAIEGQSGFLRFMGQSLGGLFGSATGASGRLEFGAFFF